MNKCQYEGCINAVPAKKHFCPEHAKIRRIETSETNRQVYKKVKIKLARLRKCSRPECSRHTRNYFGICDDCREGILRYCDVDSGAHFIVS